MGTALIVRGRMSGWLWLVAAGFLIVGLFRYGPVALAWRAFVRQDLASTRKHLAAVARPDWLAPHSQAYFHLLQAVVLSQANQPAEAAVHIGKVPDGALRNDHVRALAECLAARLALAQGNLAEAKEHFGRAERYPYRPSLQSFIAETRQQLELNGLGHP